MLKFLITLFIFSLTIQQEKIPTEVLSIPPNLQTSKIDKIVNSIFDTNECIMSTKEAKKILENDYSIYSSQIDDNIKFHSWNLCNKININNRL